MKKLLLVMMLMMSVLGMAAKKTIPKAAKKSKTVKIKNKDKVYVGEYTRSTNTFTYIKDNLVFPNKTIVYTLQDESGLLDGIYNFISSKYGVTDDDIITLKVTGTISKDGILTAKRITNYRIPDYRLHPLNLDTDTPNIDTNSNNTDSSETPEELVPSNSNTGGFFLKDNNQN